MLAASVVRLLLVMVWGIGKGNCAHDALKKNPVTKGRTICYMILIMLNV
jgi:hypothetical protein